MRGSRRPTRGGARRLRRTRRGCSLPGIHSVLHGIVLHGGLALGVIGPSITFLRRKLLGYFDEQQHARCQAGARAYGRRRWRQRQRRQQRRLRRGVGGAVAACVLVVVGGARVMRRYRLQRRVKKLGDAVGLGLRCLPLVVVGSLDAEQRRCGVWRRRCFRRRRPLRLRLRLRLLGVELRNLVAEPLRGRLAHRADRSKEQPGRAEGGSGGGSGGGGRGAEIGSLLAGLSWQCRRVPIASIRAAGGGAAVAIDTVINKRVKLVIKACGGAMLHARERGRLVRHELLVLA
mmetsp:Transcript_16357/g.37411  ORF Transcript_16357/g.37411 Transcript_16357/m.37411 type:complete len:289 (-) Transcript_16357:65-931(-)